MSFADYLRERISNDYKNLIIRKLEEIRQQTEELKDRISPSLEESQQQLRQAVQNEIVRLQEFMDRELSNSQDRVSSDFHSLLETHINSWYQANASPFDQQFELLLSDIVSNVPPPQKMKSAELEVLADLMKRLEQQNTQSEILNTLLMQIAKWVDRAVLFVVKGDQAAGWAALGLGGDWNTERVRAIRVDLNKQTILNEVATTGEISYGPADRYPDNGAIYISLGSKFPKAVLGCPIKVRGKIAGILYADCDQDFDQKPDLPELLFVATRSAGFAIDLLPLRPKVASVAKEASVSSAPRRQAQVESVAIQPPPLPPSAHVAEVHEPAVEEAVAENIAQTIEAVAEEGEEEAEGTVIMPAPAIVPPPILSDEEQKLHDDAKRFARLLVSEIKLYNEAQVAAGREHRDLYERLREDIERSRKMYQDRVPTHVHSSTNYFYEELVRTLANGDPTLLGM